MEEYSSGFTLHGVGWLLSGSVTEKIVWGASIFSVFCFAIYIINGYIGKYFKFDIRTEVRYKVNATVQLPVMIFCLTSAIAHIMECYKGKTFGSSYPCDITNYTRTTTLTYRENMLSSEWISSKYLGHDCHAINIQNTINLPGSQDYVQIKFQSKPDPNQLLELGFLSHKEFKSREHNIPIINFFQGSSIYMDPGWYSAYVSQTLIQRLRHPYPSNCSDRHSPSNSLSTFYTYPACHQLCLIKEF